MVATEVGPEVRALPVTWEERSYSLGEVSGYRFVVAATGSPVTNATVYEDGEAAGVWVNSADDPDHCSATLPAILRRGSLMVTVSTGGRTPAVASWLKERIGAELGPEYEVLVDLVAAEREAVRAGGRSSEGLNWQKALDYLGKAGDKATAAYANNDALHYYARALEVCETLGDTALATAASLGEKRGQVNFGIGELPAAIADLDRVHHALPLMRPDRQAVHQR